MSSFWRDFLSEQPTLFGRSGEVRVTVAAFGKHPGWRDYFSLGLENAALLTVHEKLHTDGVKKLLQSAHDTVLLTKLEATSQVQLDHFFVWSRSTQAVTGRLWPSHDGGRDRRPYPMFACAHCQGLAFASVAGEVLGRIEDFRAIALRLMPEDRPVPEDRRESIKQELESSRKRVQEELRLFARGVGDSGSGRGLEPAVRAGFVSDPVFGERGEGLVRVLYRIRGLFFAYARGELRDRRAAETLLPQRIRVPAAGASPEMAFRVWQELLSPHLDPAAPVLFLLPAEMGWLDIIVGEVTVNELRCLSFGPVVEKFTLATAEGVQPPPEFVALAQALIQAFKEGKPQPSLFTPDAPGAPRLAGPPPALATPSPAPASPAQAKPSPPAESVSAPPAPVPAAWKEQTEESAPAPLFRGARLWATGVVVAALAVAGLAYLVWKPPRQVVRPPLFTSQPEAQQLKAGQPLRLKAGIEGAGPVQAQWYLAEAPISRATNLEFVLDRIEPQHAGDYRIAVWNARGAITSQPAHVSVVVPVAPPRITTQPENQTALAGAPVTFRVSAEATSPLSFQWFFNGRALAQATNSFYPITAVATNLSGQYYAVVSNAGGSAASSMAVLTVNEIVQPPVIVRGPIGREVRSGEPALFEVEATGRPPLSYHWYKDNETVPLATNSVLRLAAVTPGQAGVYFVSVANSGGAATSAAARLGVQVIQPVFIAYQPDDQSCDRGHRALFKVEARGSPPFSYQWSWDGRPVGGETNQVLALEGERTMKDGSGFVVISNAAGSVTSRVARLDLRPEILAPLASSNAAVKAGAALTFGVQASGSAPLKYQWRLEGRPLAGREAPFLALAHVSPADAGSYSVSVSNGRACARRRWCG